ALRRRQRMREADDAGAGDDHIEGVVHDKRKAIMPPTVTKVPTAHCAPKRSLSVSVPSSAANSTEVSRSAATEATGACVIAHSAMPYEQIDAVPPSSASGQRLAA